MRKNSYPSGKATSKTRGYHKVANFFYSVDAMQASLSSESQTTLFSVNCPTRQILDQIANKWAVLVMLAIRSAPLRFNELKRRVEGISQKVLVETLRTLERNGLVARHVLSTKPIAVAYGLTELGCGLTKIVEQLQVWSKNTLPQTRKAQASYDARIASIDEIATRIHRA